MNFLQQELHRQKTMNDLYDSETREPDLINVTFFVYSRPFAFTVYN